MKDFIVKVLHRIEMIVLGEKPRLIPEIIFDVEDIPMCLRLRNVGNVEAMNIAVDDVPIHGGRMRWALRFPIPALLASTVSDPIKPQFSGPGGLFVLDFPMQMYLEHHGEQVEIEGKLRQWKDRNITLLEVKYGLKKREWSYDQDAEFRREFEAYDASISAQVEVIWNSKHPASATYEDEVGRKYRVDWEYEFHMMNHEQMLGKLLSDLLWSAKDFGPSVTISSFRNRLI